MRVKIFLGVIIFTVAVLFFGTKNVFAFSGSGDGLTADTAFQITTCTQLQEMENDLDAYYVLNNDIDCSDTVNWNEGTGFEPIGDSAVKFTGSFDGGENIISDLFINRPAGSYIGLFGYSDVADFENIGLEGVNITGGNYVSGLVGYSFNSNISNAYSTGSISGTNTVGGLAGNYSFGNISNSYSTASVSGTITAGGLVGNYSFGSITNSYSTGSVLGSSGFGGLVGQNFSGSVTNSFWDTDTSGQVISAGGTGKTTEEMKTQATFTSVGWNFATIWAMDELNSGYPYLQSIPPEAVTHTLTYIAGDNGSITGDSPQTVNDGGNGTAVTAVPNEGYSFVNWSDESTDNPRTDTSVTEDITVTANFAIDTHTLTYTAGDNGLITGSSPQIVNYGEDGSVVTAVPDEGYVFVNWSDDSTSNPRTDSNVTEDITVTANFAIDEVDEEEGEDSNEVTVDNTEVTDVVSNIERAKVTSWSAVKYEDSKKSCSERLKITIKGKHFDDDAKVYIGGKEALSVDVKNSKKLTAKFCLAKLTNNKTDKIRIVSVKNPGTKKREADKQIDLNNLSFENENEKKEIDNNYYNQKTQEGTKHIQEALNKLGYLDQENITSTYGSITTEAVKKFQADNGIEPTGFVGPLTKAKLAEKVK